MLKEEQAAELLRRCEALAGRELKQVRGNLRNAATRAEAVWELLFMEAVSKLGRIEVESSQGGPDIRLELPTGRWASIEVTYLHPRFEDEERRSAMVARWIHDAASSLGPDAPEIRCDFQGDSKHLAGPRRKLPLEHERKKFLASTEVAQFLTDVAAHPNEELQLQLKNYSVILKTVRRTPESQRFLGWGGSIQESPKVAQEHAAFRSLRAKLQQHKLDEPHLVCIGSDVSHALSSGMSNFDIRLEHALGAAIKNSGELSGVMVVNIAQSSSPLERISRTARCTAYPVGNCRYPLTEAEWSFIQKLDVNRWKFSFPLPRKEDSPKHRYRHVPGSLQLSSYSGGIVKLSIPASVLVEVLAGRKELLDDDYGGAEDHFGNAVKRCLQEGWKVVSCSFQDGDIQQGMAASVVLELAPPHDPVFWVR